MHTRYLGTAQIAAQLGVDGKTIVQWIRRFADTEAPFPAHDVEIGEPGGNVTRGWLPERWPEIEQWANTDRRNVRPTGRPRKQKATDTEQEN